MWRIRKVGGCGRSGWSGCKGSMGSSGSSGSMTDERFWRDSTQEQTGESQGGKKSASENRFRRRNINSGRSKPRNRNRQRVGVLTPGRKKLKKMFSDLSMPTIATRLSSPRGHDGVMDRAITCCTGDLGSTPVKVACYYSDACSNL